MKWIDINKATKLEFNLPVFTKDAKGKYGFGRLMRKEHTAKGIVHHFEMASFDLPDLNEIDTEITHIAVPK